MAKDRLSTQVYLNLDESPCAVASHVVEIQSPVHGFVIHPGSGFHQQSGVVIEAPRIRDGSVRIMGISAADCAVTTERGYSEVPSQLPVLLIEIPGRGFGPQACYRATDLPFRKIAHDSVMLAILIDLRQANERAE